MTTEDLLFDVLSDDHDLHKTVDNAVEEIFTNRQNSIREMSDRKKTLFKAANAEHDPFLSEFPYSIEEEIVVDGIRYRVTIDMEAKFVDNLPEEAVESIYGCFN